MAFKGTSNSVNLGTYLGGGKLKTASATTSTVGAYEKKASTSTTKGAATVASTARQKTVTSTKASSGEKLSSTVIMAGPSAAESAKLASLSAYRNELNRLLKEKEYRLNEERLYQEQKLKSAAEQDIQKERDTLAGKYLDYSDSAKSAYIKYMQDKRAAEQQLAAKGVTGGGKSGYNLGLKNEYSLVLDDVWTNFARHEQNTLGKIEQIRQNLKQKLEDNKQSYLNKLSTAQQSTGKSVANVDRQLADIYGKYWYS